MSLKRPHAGALNSCATVNDATKTAWIIPIPRCTGPSCSPFAASSLA